MCLCMLHTRILRATAKCNSTSFTFLVFLCQVHGAFNGTFYQQVLIWVDKDTKSPQHTVIALTNSYNITARPDDFVIHRYTWPFFLGTQRANQHPHTSKTSGFKGILLVFAKVHPLHASCEFKFVQCLKFLLLPGARLSTTNESSLGAQYCHVQLYVRCLLLQ